MVILEVNRSRHLSYRTGYLASTTFNSTVRVDHCPGPPAELKKNSWEREKNDLFQTELTWPDVYSRSENKIRIW